MTKARPIGRAFVLGRRRDAGHFAMRSCESTVPICWNVVIIWLAVVSITNFPSLAQFFSSCRLRIAAGVHLDGVDRDPGVLDVLAGADPAARPVIHAIVDRGGLVRAVAVPAVLRVQTVGQEDDDLLVGVVRVLGRHGHRAAADQRLPGPDQADRLIGAAVRIEVVDRGLHRGPIEVQPHHFRRAVAVLLRIEQRGRVARHRRRDLLVVAGVRAGRRRAAAVGDAAVPVGVGFRGPGCRAPDAGGPGGGRTTCRIPRRSRRSGNSTAWCSPDWNRRSRWCNPTGWSSRGWSMCRPSCSCSGLVLPEIEQVPAEVQLLWLLLPDERAGVLRLADAARRIARLAAGPVGAVPGLVGPVVPMQPARIVVRRADIHVLAERDDRHIDVAIGVAAAFSWSSRFLVAVLSASILPALAIEPVVSSASATRRRWLPHLIVDDAADVELRVAHHARERRVHRGRAVIVSVRAVVGGVGRRDDRGSWRRGG